MKIREEPQFQEKLGNLKKIIDMRGEARTDIDQRYLSIDGILNRLQVFADTNMLEGKRIMMIGDADLTGIAISVFGNPKEVVVADIDERLSEIYFEAMLELEAPVRYLYHDMRIKVIAILKAQYSMVVIEPPRTSEGIDVFLSRAVEIIEVGSNNHIFISLPSDGPLREHLDAILPQMKLEIVQIHPNVNEYLDGTTPTDIIELAPSEDSIPLFTDHFVRPMYEDEVNQDVHEYKCLCRKSYYVGPKSEFKTVDDLETIGCSDCGYKGIFAFKSEIHLK